MLDATPPPVCHDVARFNQRFQLVAPYSLIQNDPLANDFYGKMVYLLS